MATTAQLETRLRLEDELETARERIRDLETRLRGVLGADPTSAARALSWVGRAQNAEKLLLELERYMRENRSVEGLLPTGFYARLRAQLQHVAILRRDQEKLAERPPEEQWWEGYDRDLRVASP